MQNAATYENQHQQQQQQQISLIIIRLELDDININEFLNNDDDDDKVEEKCDHSLVKSEIVISNTDQLLKHNKQFLFKYDSQHFLKREATTTTTSSLKEDKTTTKKELLPTTNSSLDEYSEKFGSKEETLRVFIGKRKSKLLRIETYYFDKNKKQSTTAMHHHNDNYNTQPVVTNAMTMQTALETAYSDWNKNKATTNRQDGDDVDKKEEEKETTTTKSSNKMTRSSSQNEEPSSSLLSSAVSSVSLKENNNNNKISSNKEGGGISISSSGDVDQQSLKPTKQQPSDEKESSINLKASQQIVEIPYYYGNPTVDIVKGFLHIYKDCNLTSVDDPPMAPSANTLPTLRSEMLCMIGIPASITCNELVNFVMPFSENMQYIRIIRDAYPNRYMAIIKFKTQKDADLFYMYNNNKEYNSIEDNVCHLAFVERLEAINSSKGGSLPIDGFTELPTCYICLERMDESLNGVITILCNHSFHASCLSKWGDTCCPVCRFSQTPEYTVDNTCSECGSHENLWICLICGHVGCGRYVRGHAYNHFQLTSHTYSMQLGSNRVWDYAADNYVHRLIQNKTDGKLVQFDESGRVINQDEKVDSITLEYTYLLTSQLESQRLFFEDRIVKLEDKSKMQLENLETKSRDYEEECTKLKENFNHLSKEKTSLEKKCSMLNAKLNKLQSDLEEEKELNKCLGSNQQVYQSKLNALEESTKSGNAEKEKEIKDLQLQLRDIMFYLDAQSKFADSKDVTQAELQDSHLLIQQDEAAAATDNKTRRKKKK